VISVPQSGSQTRRRLCRSIVPTFAQIEGCPRSWRTLGAELFVSKTHKDPRRNYLAFILALDGMLSLPNVKRYEAIYGKVRKELERVGPFCDQLSGNGTFRDYHHMLFPIQTHVH
jgi:hypothetical protein